MLNHDWIPLSDQDKKQTVKCVELFIDRLLGYRRTNEIGRSYKTNDFYDQHDKTLQ